MLWCMLLLFSITSQVKTSLGEDAQRSMLTSDEGLLGAVAWAEGQGLDLNVFLDVVSPFVCVARAKRDRFRLVNKARGPRGGWGQHLLSEQTTLDTLMPEMYLCWPLVASVRRWQRVGSKPTQLALGRCIRVAVFFSRPLEAKVTEAAVFVRCSAFVSRMPVVAFSPGISVAALLACVAVAVLYSLALDVNNAASIPNACWCCCCFCTFRSTQSN